MKRLLYTLCLLAVILIAACESNPSTELNADGDLDLADNGEQQSTLQNCYNYCDTYHRCDTVGQFDMSKLEECKKVCLKATEPNSSFAIDTNRLSCVKFVKCDDFNNCIDSFSDKSDGDRTTDGDFVNIDGDQELFPESEENMEADSESEDSEPETETMEAEEEGEIDIVGRKLHFKTESFNNNCDLKPDTCIMTEYFYNNDGSISHLLYDGGCDRLYLEKASYTYDIDGRLIKKETDSNNDKKPDKNCEVFFYNDNGLIASQKDKDCNDTPEICTAYIHDKDGNLLTTGDDTDCDTVADEKCNTDVYENSIIIKNFNDTDCDGQPDSGCESYTYDHNGNMIGKLKDSDCDNKTDVCLDYIRDSQGFLKHTIEDADCDLVKDTCRIYQTDKNGNITFNAIDMNCTLKSTGSFSNCIWRSFDANNRILTYKQDFNCDGMGDMCFSNTYVYY